MGDFLQDEALSPTLVKNIPGGILFFNLNLTSFFLVRLLLETEGQFEGLSLFFGKEMTLYSPMFDVVVFICETVRLKCSINLPLKGCGFKLTINVLSLANTPCIRIFPILFPHLNINLDVLRPPITFCEIIWYEILMVREHFLLVVSTV